MMKKILCILYFADQIFKLFYAFLLQNLELFVTWLHHYHAAVYIQGLTGDISTAIRR